MNTSGETGASAVEYGLMLAAIAAVIIVAVFALGSMVHGMFDTGSFSCLSTSSSC